MDLFSQQNEERPELCVRLHIDGGSRGNPGPAASGLVITDCKSGKVLRQAGIYLGVATNNVAEYNGLLSGLRAAQELGASEVEVISDSELMVKQIKGEYRVKNEGLKPLYMQALELKRQFKKFSIRHTYRENNVHADKLVNQAIDMKKNVLG